MTRNGRPAPALSEDTRRLLGLSERLEDTTHKCGRCFGPYGRSAIPCPNDHVRIEAERAKRVEQWKQILKGQAS